MADDRRTGVRSLLRADRGVRLFAFARFTAMLNAGLMPTAIAFGILGDPRWSASSLGLVAASGAASLVVSLLPGGVLADRLPRRTIIVASQIVAAVSAFVPALLFATDTATILLLSSMAVVNGLAVGLSSPAATGFVPEIASPETLQDVNAVLRLSMNVARVLGTAAAGVLVATWGAGGALGIAGVAAVASAVLTALVPIQNRSPRSVSKNPLQDFRVGWLEFRARRWIVVVVVLAAVANIGVSATLGVLGPLQIEQRFSGASSWAVVTTALALGTLVGAGGATRIRPRRPLAVAVVLLIGFTLPIGALAAALPLWMIAVAAAMAGAALDVFTVLWDTTLQREVPHEMLSRVSAFDWMGTFALAPIAVAIAGPIADSIGAGAALAGAAVLTALPALALFEPEVRARRSVAG